MNRSNQFFCSLGTALKKGDKQIILPYFPYGWSILKVCCEENYLFNLQRKDDQMIAFFAQTSNKLSIKEVKRYSLSSRKVYLSHSSLSQEKDCNKLLILSTKNGIISHHHAIQNKLGGELICGFFAH